MSLIYFENLYVNYKMQIYEIQGFNKSSIDYFDAFYNQ
jgi:hypothetical protein